jgi:hypothetical protein
MLELPLKAWQVWARRYTGLLSHAQQFLFLLYVTMAWLAS